MGIPRRLHASEGPIIPVPGALIPYAETVLTDGLFYFKIRVYTAPTGVPGLMNVTVQLGAGAYVFPPRLPGWKIDYGEDSPPPVSVSGSGSVAVALPVGKLGFTLKAQASPEQNKTGIYLWLHGGPFNLSIKLLPPTIPPDVKGWIGIGAGGGSGGIIGEGGVAVRFENVPGKPIEPNFYQKLPGPSSFSTGLPNGFRFTR